MADLFERHLMALSRVVAVKKFGHLPELEDLVQIAAAKVFVSLGHVDLSRSSSEVFNYLFTVARFAILSELRCVGTRVRGETAAGEAMLAGDAHFPQACPPDAMGLRSALESRRRPDTFGPPIGGPAGTL